MQKFVLLSLVVAIGAGCHELSEEQGPMTIAQKRAGDRAMDAGRKIGVLLTSHGDIDELEEIEPYVRSAFLKNVGVPLPRFIREIIQDPAYWIAKDGIIEQYEIIGPTKYRGNAQLQADAIQDALLERGVDANIYLGYNFMPPFIEDAVDLARRDGVTDLIVFNKGAQFSLATLGESIEEIEGYMEHVSDWDINMVAVRQFSDDERFRELFAKVLRRDAATYFPNVPSRDVCLFIASHGLPLRLIRMGDPAVDQMLDVVEDLEKRLPEFPVYHGFLNDDFFPGAEWVSPPSDDTAWDIRSDSCPAVLMDGRLSFTTHHRATLFDLDVDAREIIEETPDLQPNGEVHPLYRPLTAVLAPNWDDEPGFAALMAELTIEALRGEGDLIKLH